MRNPIGCEVCGTRVCGGCGHNVFDGALCCQCASGCPNPECGDPLCGIEETVDDAE